ncbi:hypothetical protein C8J57DRAFT_1482727 [Mycena rebaudengoi]|nr:hypothetical protein C8J57DRAFT_1482727 [Mycena rebaudengoi]
MKMKRKKTESLSVEAFLSSVLRVPEDWKASKAALVEEITRSPRFSEKLHNYDVAILNTEAAAALTGLVEEYLDASQFPGSFDSRQGMIVTQCSADIEPVYVSDYSLDTHIHMVAWDDSVIKPPDVVRSPLELVCFSRAFTASSSEFRPTTDISGFLAVISRLHYECMSKAQRGQLGISRYIRPPRDFSCIQPATSVQSFLVSTSRTLAVTAAALEARFGKKVHLEENVPALRITVPDTLTPIIKITQVAHLGQVMREVFNCYRWLHETGGTLHREITLPNIAYSLEDGKAHGRGSLAFTASALLVPAPPPYLFRHGVESLLYVLVHLTCSSAYCPTNSFHGSEAAKLTFLSTDIPPSAAVPAFRDNLNMWRCRAGLRRIFRAGLDARLDAGYGWLDQGPQAASLLPFDEETLGGIVTSDAVAALLELLQ